jgi:hypothetical protein
MTTAIAAIGAFTGTISLIMTFFYHPSPPPTTIASDHSQFLRLSYSDRLDICAPYIAKNIDKWRRDWIDAISSVGGSDPRISVSAAIDDKLSPSQAIVNNMTAIEDYAAKRAQTDEGKNVASCEGGPTTNLIEPFFGSGNNAPQAPRIVVQESPIYYQGNFAGVSASGLPSKVVEVISVTETTGGQPTKGVVKQYGFALVSGRNQTNTLWAVTAILLQNQSGWVNDVPHFTGG